MATAEAPVGPADRLVVEPNVEQDRNPNPIGTRLLRLAKMFLSYGVLLFFAMLFIMPFVLAAVSVFKSLPDIARTRHHWDMTPSSVAQPWTACDGWTTTGSAFLGGPSTAWFKPSR